MQTEVRRRIRKCDQIAGLPLRGFGEFGCMVVISLP